jgi:hypothetical protein
MSIDDLAAQILADVDQAERVKLAELEAVRGGQPRFQSELGELLHKAADELRTATDEVSTEDLEQFLGGQR